MTSDNRWQWNLGHYRVYYDSFVQICGSVTAITGLQQWKVWCPDPETCEGVSRPWDVSSSLSYSFWPDKSYCWEVLRSTRTGIFMHELCAVTYKPLLQSSSTVFEDWLTWVLSLYKWYVGFQTKFFLVISNLISCRSVFLSQGFASCGSGVCELSWYCSVEYKSFFPLGFS